LSSKKPQNPGFKTLSLLKVQIWPQYQLANQHRWSEYSTFDLTILRDFDNFLQWVGKWLEVPYIQAFFLLCSTLSRCSSCSAYQLLLSDMPSPKGITKSTLDSLPPDYPKHLINIDYPLDPADEPPPASHPSTVPHQPMSLLLLDLLPITALL
jgi:hypothetical protein